MSVQRLQWTACGMIGVYAVYKLAPGIFLTDKQEQKLTYRGTRQHTNIKLLTYPVVEDFVDNEKFDVRQLAKLHFFWSNTLEPVTIGSTKMRVAVTKIGLPVNLSYTTVEDARLEDMPINTNNNASIDGLKQALVLSENAKKFLIANEIFLANTNRIYTYPILFSLLVYIAFVVFVYLNLVKVKRYRLFIDVFVLLTTAVLYRVISERYEDMCQARADRETSDMGLEFTEGGIEYLDKLIQRNVLLLAEGHTLYTKSGNKAKPWYSISMSDYTRRKTRLENILEKKLEELAAESEEEGSGNGEEEEE